MKVKWGALIVDGRNKIGGHVASKNRAGAYLRTKVTPVNPQSVSQIGVRNMLSYLSRQWQALEEDERESFNCAVEQYKATDIFGDIKIPSGFNLYMKLNLNLLGAGLAEISTAPLLGNIELIHSLTPSVVSATSISLAYTGNGLSAASVVVVEATPGVSPGQKFLKNKFRKIGVFNGEAASPYNATSDYVDKFGAVPGAGFRIGFRMKCVDVSSGVASGWIYADVVTV